MPANTGGRGFARFDSIPDAVIVVGRDGSIVYGNAHADRLFGYDHGRMIGLTLDSLIPEEFRKGHAQFGEKFFAEPAPRPMGTGRELRALRSNGRSATVCKQIWRPRSGMMRPGYRHYTEALPPERDMNYLKQSGVN